MWLNIALKQQHRTKLDTNLWKMGCVLIPISEKKHFSLSYSKRGNWETANKMLQFRQPCCFTRKKTSMWSCESPVHFNKHTSTLGPVSFYDAVALSI